MGSGNTAEPGIRRCYVARPINCATGNLTETQVDLAVQGNGPPLQMVRTYNSQLAVTQNAPGALGYGWTGSYSAKITFTQEKTVATVTHDNGSTITFALSSATGQWNSPVWTQATFAKNGENYLYTQPDHTNQEFNSNGRLLKITDRHNVSLTLAYDTNGRLASVTDQSSIRQITFTYNASGQIEKVTDPLGRVAKYTYSSGNLASVTLPGAETPRWKFGYNTFHEMTTETTGRGYSTTTSFDTSHRATTQTDPLGRKYTFAYKETNGVDETTITRPNGEVTLEKFNEAGAPTTITRGAGTTLEATTTYVYNTLFLVVSVTDPNKHTTTYTYDGRGNRLTEKDPNGNETKWAYNTSNDVISETSPKGQVTSITRNTAGDPLVVKRSFETLSQEDKFEYNSYGNVMKHTDPAGRIWIYTYGGSGVLGWKEAEYVASAVSENLLQRWKYNLNSEIVEEVGGRGFEAGNEEAGFTTKITRDSQGRPTTITSPLGNTVKTVYDANGNVTSVVDGNGHATTYVYDSDDQQTEVKAANGSITKKTYDSMGEVASQANGNGNVTEYKRDLLGRLIETIDPLGRKGTYAYDRGGNLVKAVDAESRSVVYTYDPGDRLTKTDYSDVATADVSLVYDKNGGLVEMVDGTGTTKRVYDGLDRPVEVVNGKTEAVKYEYNLAGDITKLTYPNGKSVVRGFDSVGRLAKVVDWLGKETKFSYYRDSLPRSTTFPAESGNVDEYTYNAQENLTKTSIMKGAETLGSLVYGRDKAGQLISTVQKGLPGGEALGYEYDAVNRLVKGGSSSYEYDLTGNLKKESSGGWSESFTYDAASQLVSATERAFVYNKVGQRVKYTPLEATPYNYSYDQAGNLTSVQRSGEFTNPINETYKYDGSGLRVSESVAGTAYPMVWDATAEVPLLLTDGRNSYIYGPNGLPIEQIGSAGQVLYLHHDQQGSTRLLTASTGKVEGAYAFGPYGVTLTHTGTASTPLGYRGEYRSPTSGLIYLRARVYDPDTAQFLSVDPMVASSGEPYSYAADNPVNLADPLGLIAEVGLCGCPECPRFDPYKPIKEVLPFLNEEPATFEWPRPELKDIFGNVAQDLLVDVLGGGKKTLAKVALGVVNTYGQQVIVHNLKLRRGPDSRVTQAFERVFKGLDEYGKSRDLKEILSRKYYRQK
jgi:RHS repeat-associated protein